MTPGYEEFGNKILKAAQQLLQLNNEASKTKDVLTQIVNLPPLDPLGSFNPQREMEERAARTPSMLQQRQSRMDAYRQSAMARSFAEREAAVRASAESQFDINESPSARKDRIEMAVFEARVSMERELLDAQRERKLNLERILADQQSEIGLVGKTGGAAAALRKEYELTSALRLDAARTGNQVDEREIALIKQKTEEYGKYVDALNQRRFAFDMNQQMQDARLSPRQRQIVTTLRQYGLPEDLNGANARAVGQQVNWQENKELVGNFFSAIHDGAWQNGGKIGKAIGEAALQGLQSMSKKLWENVFDGLSTMVSNWMTGRNGGVSGVAANVGSSIAARLTPANDNAMAAPVGAVARAPLGNISSYAKAIQSIESSGNYGALGPITRNGDRAYGAYQVMGNNIGPWSEAALGRRLSPDQFLADKSAQDAIFNHRFGGYVDKYGASGAAQAWFGGPSSVGKGGTGADVLGTTGNAYVEKFNSALGNAGETASEALDKLAGNAGAATQGLGKIGSALSAFPAAPTPNASGGGGGGILGWLGNLFGGFSPNGAQATLAASGSISGMFAGGTNNAPGGLSLVGERGPELLNLPQGSGVVSNHKLMEALSQRDGGQGGIAGIRLFVDQDGNWQAKVESIAEKKANSASRQNLGGYKQNQQRSGYGDDQKRYMSRKG